MSEITITDLLCYEHAEFQIDPGCTLITGPNSSGKTSLANILGALASHDGNPARLSATAQKAYIRDGQPEGVAVLDTHVRWTPPNGMTLLPGTAPEAPPHAVGLVDFIRPRQTKEAAALWEGLFLPSDPRPLLEPHWTMPPAQLEAALNEIAQRGWESAVKLYRERATQAKGAWQQITGRPRWGSKMGAEWLPDGWTTDLDGASVEQLAHATEHAREKLRALTSKQAVSEHEIAEAKRVLEEEIPQAQKEIDRLQEEYNEVTVRLRQAKTNHTDSVQATDAARVGLQDAIRAKDALTEAPTEADGECPSCGEELDYEDGAIVLHEAPDPPTEAEIAAAETAVRAAEEKVTFHVRGSSEESAAIDSLEKAAAKSKSDLDFARGSHAALLKRAALADATPSAAADEAAVAAAETAVRAAEEKQRALTRFTDARRAHENVVEADAVATLLGPTGARAAHMVQYMDAVRKVITASEKHTGWKPVRIGEEYQLISGGRPIALVAENERLKAQWLCQLAVAWLTSDCGWLVLDCGDRLRGEHWDGLVRLCGTVAEKRPELKIVLCATDAETPEGWQEIRL